MTNLKVFGNIIPLASLFLFTLRIDKFPLSVDHSRTTVVLGSPLHTQTNECVWVAKQ